MAAKSNFTRFFRVALAEFGTVPRRGLVYIGAASTASATSNLYFWTHRPELLPADYVIGALLLIGWAVATYAASMRMIGARLSRVGFGKFALTSGAMVLPMLLSFGLLFLAAETGSDGGFAGALVLMLGSFVWMSLLPGWPVLQATSTKLVGPLMALRSTRGFRWSLVVAAFAAASSNRLVPDISSTGDPATACVMAIGGGLVAAASAIFALSIAVAAWRLMQPMEATGPNVR